MQGGRGSREQGESVRRWLEERQAERDQRAARNSVPAGDAGAPRQEEAAYDGPYGSFSGPVGSAVDERAPSGYGRSQSGTTWEPTPSPSWDAGEPVPPAATKPRRRRRFGWWKRIALVVLILISAVVGMTLYF